MSEEKEKVDVIQCRQNVEMILSKMKTLEKMVKTLEIQVIGLTVDNRNLRLAFESVKPYENFTRGMYG